MVRDSVEQHDSIHVNTMSMAVDLWAAAQILSPYSQTADKGAAPPVADIATSPHSKLFTLSEEPVSV